MKSHQETLHFKIVLSGSYWNNVPGYAVLVDDTVIKRDAIKHKSNELFEVEFSQTLDEGPHSLKIRLENKTINDTQLDANGNIVNDMLLNIEDIVIDDISIGSLKWTKSEYITDSEVLFQGKRTNTIKNCVNLGFNGSYILEFTLPYYVWLLENL